MKKIGLAKIEKESTKKLAQGRLKASPWLATVESAIDDCIDRIPKFAVVYQKSYNFPKEKCDAQYTFFNDCLEVIAFSVS
jgi:tRNA U34 5-methylaminomethyl-2-thiouridine-forming methyltransferase MnmC